MEKWGLKLDILELIFFFVERDLDLLVCLSSNVVLILLSIGNHLTTCPPFFPSTPCSLAKLEQFVFSPCDSA